MQFEFDAVWSENHPDMCQHPNNNLCGVLTKITTVVVTKPTLRHRLFARILVGNVFYIALR